MIVIWNRPLQLYLTALVALQLLPLFAIIPTWVALFALGLVVWKALNLWKGVRVPNRGLVAAIGALGLLGILATKRTLLGEDAATAGFAIIAGCKLLETNRYRDVMMAIVLCFLLLMSQLLFNQGLGMLLFLIVDAILLVQLLLLLHPANISLFSFRTVGKLVLMVVPIWVALFFVFPRFTVGFWRREVQAVTSGFSEDMNPGLISAVVQTDELAFRVRFSGGSEPKPNDLYFRGAILAQTEGLHWTKAPARLPLEDYDYGTRHALATSSDYEIWLEPLFRQWMFTPDYADPRLIPTIEGQNLQLLNGGVLESRRPIASRVVYEGRWSTVPFLQRQLSELERKVYLQLPPSLDSRVRELAYSLRERGDALKSLTNLYLWFAKQKFYYTITPGETADLSQFLFETRIGFCEHYAAAAAVLLRAMGYPARVVVGYQGSERNTLSDYYIVRNRNAHAWAEVWMQGELGGHWQRVDLTSAVEPMRITLGVDYYRIASQLAQNANLSAEAAQQLAQSGWERVQSRLRLALDAAEMGWVRFLIAFDFQSQQQLISRFGIRNASRFTFIVIVAALLALAFLVLMWALQRRTLKTDPVLKEWRRLCERLAARGIVRGANEGPLDYIRRASEALPAEAPVLRALGDEFVRLRYEQLDEVRFPAVLAEFRRAVRRYRPGT